MFLPPAPQYNTLPPSPWQPFTAMVNDHVCTCVHVCYSAREGHAVTLHSVALSQSLWVFDNVGAPLTHRRFMSKDAPLSMNSLYCESNSKELNQRSKATCGTCFGLFCLPKRTHGWWRCPRRLNSLEYQALMNILKGCLVMQNSLYRYLVTAIDLSTHVFHLWHY